MAVASKLFYILDPKVMNCTSYYTSPPFGDLPFWTGVGDADARGGSSSFRVWTSASGVILVPAKIPVGKALSPGGCDMFMWGGTPKVKHHILFQFKRGNSPKHKHNSYWPFWHFLLGQSSDFQQNFVAQQREASLSETAKRETGWDRWASRISRPPGESFDGCVWFSQPY